MKGILIMKKMQYVTNLNVLACIAVVYLHANGAFWNFSTERYWKTANIIETLFYWAVPIFFMISGVTLMNYPKRYTTKQFFQKRFSKTVVPFLFWAVVSIPIGFFFGMVDPFSLNLEECLRILMDSTVNRAFWYFFPLFSLYLAIPLFAYIDERRKAKVFLYGIYTWCLFNFILIPLARDFNIPFNYDLNQPAMGGYIVYAFAGYVLSHRKISLKMEWAIYILGVIGFFTQLIGTYYLSMQDQAINTFFKGYLNWPCFFYSLSVFVLIKKRIVFSKPVTSWFDWFSKYCFAIYLLHYPLTMLARYKLGLSDTSIWFRLISPIFIIAACILITIIIRKVPYFKRVLPE